VFIALYTVVPKKLAHWSLVVSGVFTIRPCRQTLDSVHVDRWPFGRRSTWRESAFWQKS